jgi:hypothetical protein
MNPNDPANLYADSPDRMLYLSILLLVAIVLLVLWNHTWGKKSSARPAAPSAELPAATTLDQSPWPHWVEPEHQKGPS